MEDSVSLVDVIEEDEILEEEASAVLAGSDSDLCSYPQGYVKRQALYACKTCSGSDRGSGSDSHTGSNPGPGSDRGSGSGSNPGPGSGAEPAGVCLACSYQCHEGHDLYELYTKRDFCCDCGNKKFPGLTCKLFPDKDDLNTKNKYSQNFSGLYCICSRPYPDPEDSVEDEMIQCVVCEDWLHGRHLGVCVPECVETLEMICERCMNKHSFLWTYATEYGVAQVKQEEADDVTDDVTEPSCKRSRGEAGLKQEERQEGEGLKQEERQDGEEPKTAEESRGAEHKPQGAGLKPEQPEGAGPKPEQPIASVCLLEQLGGAKSSGQSGAVFWPSSWRSKLCQCCSCKERLSALSLSFLCEHSDTVLFYETEGRNKQQHTHAHAHTHTNAHTHTHTDPLMTALNNLNHVQQLDIIHGYNDMKTELKDFLQRFALEGKVVTPEDIRTFFDQQKKRRRDH